MAIAPPLYGVKGSSMGGLNVGLAAAIGFLNPLGAQIDALLAVGLGPLQFDLGVQFNAALSLQATLSIQVGNPLAALQAAIAAVAQLQVALQAALSLPAITVSIGAELGASAALGAALAVKLGALELLIAAALNIKIPAIKFAASLDLTVGPLELLRFDGSLADSGNAIQAAFTDPAGMQVDAVTLFPSDPVLGIILVGGLNVGASFNALFNAGF